MKLIFNVLIKLYRCDKNCTLQQTKQNILYAIHTHAVQSLRETEEPEGELVQETSHSDKPINFHVCNWINNRNKIGSLIS